MLKIYPHPQLPLFPKRLLPFVRGQSLSVRGMGEVPILKLTKMKVGDVPREHRNACLEAVKVLMRTLFFGKHKDNLAKITLGLPTTVKISDLCLNERAQAALGDGPFFKSTGPWRTNSLREEIHGISPSVGPRLFLALILAAEAITQKEPERKKEISLEEELGTLVKDVVHSERNASIFLQAHGWHGKGPKPLATIADELKLTHERVRQIVRSAESSMRKHSLRTGDLACLRKAVSVLASNSPMQCQDGAALLREQGIASGLFDVQGVLDAADFFGLVTGMDRWVWEGSAFVRRNDARNDETPILMGTGLAQTLSHLHRDIRRSLRVEGALHVDEEAEKLKTKYGVSTATVRFAFQIYGDGKFTGLDDTWFVSRSNSERVRKIHALVRWLGGQPVHALVRACDASRLFSTKPPAEVMESLLIGTGLFKKAGEKMAVIAANVFDRNEEVQMESAIVKILNEVGGTMPRHLLRHRLIAEGKKSEEMAKQLRSSLLFKADGKIVEIKTIADATDIDASFVASMEQGIDFRAFSENLLMDTTNRAN